MGFHLEWLLLPACKPFKSTTYESVLWLQDNCTHMLPRLHKTKWLFYLREYEGVQRQNWTYDTCLEKIENFTYELQAIFKEVKAAECGSLNKVTHIDATIAQYISLPNFHKVWIKVKKPEVLHLFINHPSTSYCVRSSRYDAYGCKLSSDYH